MAALALTDASVTVNGTDLSDHVRKVTINGKADENDKSAMGTTWHQRIAGFKDFTISLDFNQDFAASKVDATIWPLLGTSVAVVIKPTSSAVGSTNPSYTGNVLISDYTPLDGNAGDLAVVSVTWNGDGALVRATS